LAAAFIIFSLSLFRFAHGVHRPLFMVCAIFFAGISASGCCCDSGVAKKAQCARVNKG
jgi:hypothetical protein